MGIDSRWPGIWLGFFGNTEFSFTMTAILSTSPFALEFRLFICAFRFEFRRSQLTCRHGSDWQVDTKVYQCCVSTPAFAKRLWLGEWKVRTGACNIYRGCNVKSPQQYLPVHTVLFQMCYKLPDIKLQASWCGYRMLDSPILLHILYEDFFSYKKSQYFDFRIILYDELRSVLLVSRACWARLSSIVLFPLCSMI